MQNTIAAPHNSFSPLHIAIVAPSGAPLDEDAVLRGLAFLRQLGHQVHSYYQPEEKFQRFAASDQLRVAHFHAAAANPDVDVVIALRGSYGLSRLMPYLDLDLLAQSGKIFVGYSDFTLMHQAMLARGVKSVAGPMLGDFSHIDGVSDYTLQQFSTCLSGNAHRVEFMSQGAPDMQLNGRLWGGNLAMLVHTLGTPYWTQIDDGILFLEDIGEHPYRVERMLLQLHFAGVLDKQKAIILGDFSGYRLAPHDNGYDFAEMLKYVRSILRIPVLSGLPFGHIRDHASLVIGSDAHVRVEDGSVMLHMQYLF
ncbi:LD-carboxypeptidase [Undibacterium sp. SXout20W]|uniref:LD-carboxypeptidase n=1 Tax=Undibacterium sp. SXout20W TaxID=3413051 RepID=UPI003BF051BA